MFQGLTVCNANPLRNMAKRYVVKIRENDSNMKSDRIQWLFILMLMMGCIVNGVAYSQDTEQISGSDAAFVPAGDTLTGDWFGFGKTIEQYGLSVNLHATQLYQQNVSGGLSTHRRKGRYSGRYDLELDADLDKLINLPGGRVYMLTEGDWSQGINGPSVGSLFGVDGLAQVDDPIYIWELYYEQMLFDDKVLLRAGRIDLTSGFECHDCPASFDCNAYANDETRQFLNNSLINNPTIPFSDPGLGVILHVTPVEWWYVSAAVADANANSHKGGFSTAFHGPENTFSIYEMGFVPNISSKKGRLPGTYRLGMWYDPQKKQRFDGNGFKSDDMGFYLSCDQMLFKENSVADDSQGLGVFARYGHADGAVNEIANFWSVGAQYQGLIEGRDNDVLAVGVGQGLLSRSGDFTASNETALECYYNMQITPWLHVSPDIQYIFNPGGDASVQDAVVLGVRVGIMF